jgi:hypothetical protein
MMSAIAAGYGTAEMDLRYDATAAVQRGQFVR